MTAAPAGDAPSWVQLAETAELYEAKLMALRLEEAGIATRVLDQTFHQEPMPSVRAISLVRVLVASDRLAEARAVLATPRSLPDDADPGEEPTG